MPRASKTGVRGLFGNARDGFEIDLRWTDPRTNVPQRYRERLPTGTPAKAAKARAREILSGALAGTFDPQRAAPMRLSAAWTKYGEWCDTNIPASAGHRRAHGRAILEILGDVALPSLTGDHVQRIKVGLMKRAGIAVIDTEAEPPPVFSTINRHLATFKHMTRIAARDWKAMPREAAFEIREARMMRQRAGREREMSDEEGTRIWPYVPERIRALCFAAILTGMRQGELRRLAWSQVDRSKATITVRRTKTGKVKHVAITPALAELLDGQREAFPEAAHVFVDPDTGEALRKPQVTHAWAKACKRAGVDDLHFHDLRHTFASQLAQAGESLHEIGLALGHSSPQTTARYSHGSATSRQRAARNARVPGLAVVAQPLPEPVNLAAERAARSGS